MVIDAETRQFAGEVFRRFEAIPVEPDGSIYIPPDVYHDLVDLALDVLGGPESRAKAGAPAILQILTADAWLRRQLEIIYARPPR